MAKIYKGLLKGASGRLDNIIITNWKDITIIKGLPYTRERLYSKQELMQHNKFKRMIEFATTLKSDIITPIWNPIAKGMNGFNFFIKTNSIIFRNDSKYCNYSKLIISKGCLDAPNKLVVKIAPSNYSTLILSWSFENQIPSYNDNDRLNVIIFKNDIYRNQPIVRYNIAQKKDQKTKLFLDITDNKTTLEIFAFFSSTCFNSFSDSVHRELIRTSSYNILDNPPR